MPSCPAVRAAAVATIARLLAGALVLAAAPAGAVEREPVRTLVPGDPDRRALLDLLRPVLEQELRGPVEFRVVEARAVSGWGMVKVEPQRPGGGRIAMRETVFADAPFMDGLTTDALFRRRGERWYLITHVVGPSDAAASNWIFGTVPSRLYLPDDASEGNPP